jgi:hypothetical protein
MSFTRNVSKCSEPELDFFIWDHSNIFHVTLRKRNPLFSNPARTWQEEDSELLTFDLLTL